jgi:chromatin remodeling complex protein RSC6
MVARIAFDARTSLSHNPPNLKRSRGKETMASTKTASGSKGGGKGLAAAVQPSADLAPITGDKPIPRSEVTKRVWDYIKAHGLQDQQNRRMINADDNLKKIFNGKKQVSMFEMTALVNKHLS